jgi:hypothetical protein
MNHQRVQQSSSWNPPIQPKSSLLARYHFSEPANSDFHQPPTQEDIENEAFDCHQFEASRLQLKAESDTIAPDEQERLGVLQGKMRDFWAHRQERASRFAHNFAQIPAHAPDAQQANPKHQPQFLIPAFQAKLTIGQPRDRYEQEADRVASEVVEQINTRATSVQPRLEEAVQRQEEPSISSLLRSPFPPAIGQEAIAGGDTSPTLESAVNRAKGGGHPLDAGLQQSMGQAMGADFSKVRVHSDATSNQLNQSIHARAFTTGQDVFFKRGAYDPNSKGGQKLIAHELTHVIQQDKGTQQRGVLQREVDVEQAKEWAIEILQELKLDRLIDVWQNNASEEWKFLNEGLTGSENHLKTMDKDKEKFRTLLLEDLKQRGELKEAPKVRSEEESKHLVGQATKHLKDVDWETNFETEWAKFVQSLKAEGKDINTAEEKVIKVWLRNYKAKKSKEEKEKKDQKKEDKQSDLAESEKSKATPKPEPVYWNGAQAEVAAFMQLTNLVKDPEGAFARLRQRIPQWTDEQRQLFMQQLPREYHNLAFGAAMGADYSLEWVPSYSISKSAPLAGTQQMYDWLYRDGPEPKKCNCWEAVYLAAYRVGKINKQRIKALLPNPNRDGKLGPMTLANAIMHNGHNVANQNWIALSPEFKKRALAGDTTVLDNRPWSDYTVSDQQIQQLQDSINPGDILMFGNEGSHFSISLGGDKAIETDKNPEGSDVRIVSIKSTIRRKVLSYGTSIWWVSAARVL